GARSLERRRPHVDEEDPRHEPGGVSLSRQGLLPRLLQLTRDRGCRRVRQAHVRLPAEHGAGRAEVALRSDVAGRGDVERQVARQLGRRRNGPAAWNTRYSRTTNGAATWSPPARLS